MKKATMTAILGALMMFGGAGVAQATQHDCRMADRAEVRLDQAIARHGENSHQANHQRRILEKERARCVVR
jgi:hypothetical protein